MTLSNNAWVKVGYTDDGTLTPIYQDTWTGLFWFGCGFAPVEGDDD